MYTLGWTWATQLISLHCTLTCAVGSKKMLLYRNRSIYHCTIVTVHQVHIMVCSTKSFHTCDATMWLIDCLTEELTDLNNEKDWFVQAEWSQGNGERAGRLSREHHVLLLCHYVVSLAESASVWSRWDVMGALVHNSLALVHAAHLICCLDTPLNTWKVMLCSPPCSILCSIL